jgi:hypothetical protein
VRLDDDEMTADADDGDAGDFSRTYMTKPLRLRVHRPTPSITSPIRG